MSKTRLTKAQTSKVVNWLRKNLDAIHYGNEQHDYWRLKCSKELGFMVSTCVYNNRLYQLKYGKLPEEFRDSTSLDRAVEAYGLEEPTVVRDNLSDKLLDLANEMIKSEQLIAVLQESEASQAQEIFDLKAKLKLEVENNRQLANAQASSDQVANQTKIIEKLKDDKNKEFIRMSAIIAEQKDEILNLRSEVESLKDKVTDLEITKSVSKGYGQFGFSFNIPQPSVKF